MVELQQQLASAQAVILPKPLPPFRRPPPIPPPESPSPSASSSLPHFSSVASFLPRAFCALPLLMTGSIHSGLHVRRCDSQEIERWRDALSTSIKEGDINTMIRTSMTVALYSLPAARLTPCSAPQRGCLSAFPAL